MAQFIPTKEEVDALTFLEWDDASIGKLVKDRVCTILEGSAMFADEVKSGKVATYGTDDLERRNEVMETAVIQLAAAIILAATTSELASDETSLVLEGLIDGNGRETPGWLVTAKVIEDVDALLADRKSLPDGRYL